MVRRLTIRFGASVFAGFLAAAAWAAGVPVTGEDFDAITGYRIKRYRAALPEWAPGSTRIFAADLAALVKDRSAILVDVMASEGASFDPATGEWRLTKSHDTIPGAVWLPDVGKGALDARLETYFRKNLERLTVGDKTRAIVLFCQSDCWMSWNAVRRAAGFGYWHIYWLPEGIDGWRDWDGPVTPAVPLPVKP